MFFLFVLLCVEREGGSAPVVVSARCFADAYAIHSNEAVREMEKEAGVEGATLGQAAEEVQRFRLDQPVCILYVHVYLWV